MGEAPRKQRIWNAKFEKAIEKVKMKITEQCVKDIFKVNNRNPQNGINDVVKTALL